MDRPLRGFLMILLLFSVNVQATTARSPNPNFPSKTYVEIDNHLPEKLTLHCKSKDDDLGVQELQPQTRWGFRFQPKLFVETTLFYCTFAWFGSPVQTFDIYVERRDASRCKNCIWGVYPAGPCLYLDPPICYSWNS
ncbi:hypothetical protein MLD38_004772 [Melastoma candidum]|uniref:Uncharacterized protein n=1 Tax=Melastoma candidum TaxID=119954 RepID=A0ACB9S6H0_9MYRT|nr:hypothetical protein MLD38_004772 [Melastoma candidum]